LEERSSTLKECDFGVVSLRSYSSYITACYDQRTRAMPFARRPTNINRPVASDLFDLAGEA